MWVSAENIPEEGGASRENYFVCLDLTVITGESYIKEILFFSQFSECHTDIAFEVIPAEAKLIRGGHAYFCCWWGL